MNYTHVAQRPVAHHGAAVEAQASDRTNVKTGLPNNYAERYRGIRSRSRASAYCRIALLPAGRFSWSPGPVLSARYSHEGNFLAGTGADTVPPSRAALTGAILFRAAFARCPDRGNPLS